MPNTRFLYLLRHGKSDWGDASLGDHDRPLAPRGQRAAKTMGTYLAERDPLPERVVCSTALRARETLERVLAHLPREPEVRIEKSLYLASPAGLLEHVRALPPETRCAMLVGHNPGMGDLARRLAGSGDEAAYGRLVRKYPTAALAEIEFDLDWVEVAPSAGRLAAYTVPRDFD